MEEFSILAKVNQNVITNYELQNRMEAMEILIPKMKTVSRDEKTHYAIQSLIQDELRADYAKKTNFKLTKEQKVEYTRMFVNDLQKKNVKNIKSFIQNYGDFVDSEVLWYAVIETAIRPKVQISQELISDVSKKEPKLSRDKIKEMLVDQQIQGQSAQILESIRKISIIEFAPES